jgi:hypothetical protein
MGEPALEQLPIDLDPDRAMRALFATFGGAFGATYVEGKTLLRDALCAALELSQLDAEDLVDALEQAGRLCFTHADELGDLWVIHEEETGR